MSDREDTLSGVAMTEQCGFLAHVLTEHGGSCGGQVASRAGVVLVVGENLPKDARIHPAGADDVLVTLDTNPFGEPVFRPLDAQGRMVRGMASGAFLHTSDAWWRRLFGHSLPIPMHDRVERH